MKTKTIKQTIIFDAAPEDVYSLLMNAKKHASLTGSTLKMAGYVNGEFEIFGGYVHGYNIELEKGRKIVQAWHFNEDEWPEEHFSICTFIFEMKDNKTELTFTQTEVPESNYESLVKGWKEYYWDPMKIYLKSSIVH